jgi:hypothetical protein
MVCVPRVQGQSQRASDSTRAAAFDRLDRTSRALMETINCAHGTARARADGIFGPPDSLGRTGQCLRQDGRVFGVFFTHDSTFARAQNLRVVDLAKRTRYLGSVDTAAILAEGRAADEGVLKAFPSFVKANRPFAPFSMRSDGDSIEVWLLPAGLLMGRTPAAIGGERGFIYSPDGRTLVREIDAFDEHRALTVPDSGRVDIRSRQEDLPLVSELFATNVLFDQGREVRLITNKFISYLVGPRGGATWIQLKLH